MVVTYLIVIALGALICVLGILNMRGNLSSIHWYHRQRVTEENKRVFGRLVGGGTLAVGASVILFSVFLWLHDKFALFWILPAGLCLLFAGIAAGLILSFYAMIKYNKGLF